MSHLNQIIGKVVKSIRFDLSETLPINQVKLKEDNALIEFHLQITFQDYILSVYNQIKIFGIEKDDLNDLQGYVLKNIIENEKYVSLIFDGNISIEIDLSESGYLGPEAMHLKGPNNLNVVWD